jgi:alpha-glucosidase
MTGASNPLRRLAMKAVLAAREVVALGPATSAAIVAGTSRMTVRQRRDARAEDRSAIARVPGRLLSVDPEPYGVRCHFAEAELEVRFLGDDVVRLTWGPGDRPIPWARADPDRLRRPAGPVSTVIGPGCTLATPATAATPATPATAATAGTAALRVEVSPDGDVRYFGGGGLLVRHELPPLRRGPSRTLRQVLRPGERVAGLGEQASRVDLRGTTHRLWNRDPGGAWGPGQDPLYCAIPVMVGLHPDGDVLVFHDNPYDATVRIDGAVAPSGTAARAELTFAGGMLEHYVMVGPLPRLLDRYSDLTGRPPLPPRWALGYHQSKWGYRSEADVREVADGFRDEGVPLSAVHLDIDYMDGYRIFTVDRQRFPDLAGLVGDLSGRGTRVVTIVDPGVKVDPGYEVFREGRESGRFLLGEDGRPLIGVVWPGRAAFPDFTDPDTRRWWAGLYRPLLDAGVAGMWHDMNEPTSITLWGDRTLPRGTGHVAEGRGGDHRQCHNVYGLLMDRAGWEAQAAERPDRRPWVLSRSGWAGLQRWAWNWTADIESSWEGLRQQVATTIGLGLSGVPYTGSDIGGFSGVPGPELFLRWLELSVLMPFCRTHSVMGSPNREPWRFPEPYRTAIDRLIRFRYRLLPYLYTLAYEATRTGHPLVRPLCWPAGGVADDRLWQVDDAYLLGDALLVAPVTEEGARSRPVPLPAGRWYRWRALPGTPVVPPAAPGGESGADEVTTVEGGRTVLLDTPAGQPVVLVRAGTVLPLDDGWEGAAFDTDAGAGGSPAPSGAGLLASGHEPRLLALHCFPAGDGGAVGECYDDAGDGDGPWRFDRFHLAAAPAGGRVLRWERDGEYRAPSRVRVVVHGEAATAMECGPFTERELR